MIGAWCKMTTTTASGATAIAGLAAVAGFPTVGDMIQINAFCWYVILDATDKPLEAGVGKLTSVSNINRVRACKTYSASVYDDTDPVALTLASGTEYRLILSAIDASNNSSMPGLSTTFFTKAITSAASNGGIFNGTMVDDRQYFTPFKLEVGGVLKGFVFDVNTAGANSVCQAGVYALDHNGEPTKLLARSGDVSTATTGSKSPVSTTTPWLAPGWYAVSLCSKNAVDTVAPTVRSISTPPGGALPWGFNNSGGNMTETYGSIYKAIAAWVDLADVDVTVGGVGQTGGSVSPLVALKFE